MSTTTETPWRSDVYGLLLHPREPRALLLPQAGGWSLPHAVVDRAVWATQAGAAAEALRPLLGSPEGDAVVLRYAAHTDDREARTVDAVFVLEPRDPAWRPPAGALWAGRADVARLPLARPEHGALIDAQLAEVESGAVPELRSPWARRGWFAEAAAWTLAELERLGYQPAGPVEQVRSWGISCVLRARTATGDVYFKVASSRPLFAHEPALLRGLARLYPGDVPAPLAVDEERRWMLLADFGPAVGWNAAVDAQEAMLHRYAELQRDAAPRVDELRALGCLDRRLPRLAEEIDPLLADDAVLAKQLSPEETERLRAAAPRLKALCAELRTYALPETLVHGDLHLGNVAQPGGRYLFFDWTDACIAHPFFDTISVFQVDDPAVRERLRDGYLSVWTAYEPRARLLEAWALAAPLCALHQAVSYRYIVNTLEDAAKNETASGVPYWARKALEWLR